MIGYKRDVLERQSLSEVKMGRGSPICERVRKKIVEYFKNNGPQRQIAKALQISSSTVHNIIKRFRKTSRRPLFRVRTRCLKYLNLTFLKLEFGKPLKTAILMKRYLKST